jgi:hypothetical protein
MLLLLWLCPGCALIFESAPDGGAGNLDDCQLFTFPASEIATSWTPKDVVVMPSTVDEAQMSICQVGVDNGLRLMRTISVDCASGGMLHGRLSFFARADTRADVWAIVDDRQNEVEAVPPTWAKVGQDAPVFCPDSAVSIAIAANSNLGDANCFEAREVKYRACPFPLPPP